MEIIRAILNEDFLDSIPEDDIAREEVEADSENDCQFGFRVCISAIPKNKKMDYVERIHALFRMLNKSFTVATKIRDFKRLGENTPVALKYEYSLCDADDSVNGQRFLFKNPPYEPVQELIDRRSDI